MSFRRVTVVRRPLLIAALAVGIGLALAPVAFQMFTRAPKGGDMIEGFRPYMNEESIGKFRGYLDVMGRADAEAYPHLVGTLKSPDAVKAKYGSFAAWHDAWPGINADMGDMLETMKGDIDAYEGVRALPPFALFPWFFVAPGVMVAALAGVALFMAQKDKPVKPVLKALAVMGVAIMAAPVVFQMFTRAPKGGRMINDFKPMMTEERVTRVQGYFLTIGAGEGQLRNQVLPTVAPDALPAVRGFSTDWPNISMEMGPMIGAMADNVDNFNAVKAMPPFALFPWFFVIPGALVVGFALGGTATRRTPATVESIDTARGLRQKSAS